MATVNVRAGDTWCSIAVDAGFRNCRQLRAANAGFANRQLQPGDVVTLPHRSVRRVAGATLRRHVFRRRGVPLASIRFVHGSRDLPCRDDPPLAVLNISNYVTNMAGAADGAVAFPNDTVRQFNADAHQDEDTFKIEVRDLRTGRNDLPVQLEALRPVYDAAGVVTGVIRFVPPELARRSLNVTVSKQRGTRRFRSCYLRLVVDDDDKAAAPTQTLLVTDMTDQGDPQVEILDQRVKATYILSGCQGHPPCEVSAELPIGTDRRRLRVAVHVLRPAVGGAPVVTVPNADRRVRTWFRRVYAQAGIAPKLVQPTRAVHPVENLVSISNDSGQNAGGDGQLGFSVRVGATWHAVGPINPAVGQSPLATANALAALVVAPYIATVTQNPARFPDPPGQGSADILIAHNTGALVQIGHLVSADSQQTVTVGRANPANLLSWDGNNWLVGSIEQRAILKNYDTGDDRVDIFVVTQLTSGDRGQAMMSGHIINPGRRAIDTVKWSAFLVAIAMDGTNNNPFSFPHEVGHVTGELVHAQGAVNQLMRSGTSAANAVDGSKRLRDGNVTYGNPAGNFNLVNRLRAEGAPLLENW